MKNIKYLIIFFVCITLTGCSITESQIQLTKEEKSYIKELKSKNKILNCQPTIGEIDKIHSELCRKSGVQHIGIEVAF